MLEFSFDKPARREIAFAGDLVFPSCPIIGNIREILKYSWQSIVFSIPRRRIDLDWLPV